MRPIAKPPTAATCAPAFVVRDGGRSLQTVAPLSALEFRVEPRSLPPLQELSATAEGGLAVDAAAVAAIAVDALARSQQQREPPLACLLGVRQALLALLPEASRGAVEVVFEGVELGRVCAVLQPVPAGKQRSVTGLEGSALGGQGWGIDPFQRRAPRQQQQAVSADGLRIELGSQQSGSSSSSSMPQPQRLLPWSAEQLAAAEASAGSSDVCGTDGNALAALLTQTYARFQAAAGKTVGISPGAAWRTALQAAMTNGASQVLLGDRPSGITAARLAAGIWEGSGLQLLASIPAACASGIVVGQALEPGPAATVAAAAAALLPLAAGAWPFAGPLLEIAAFSRKSATEIEELVRVKEPLSQSVGSRPYKLWGEDALLNWPGAMGPVISDRDAYMARACASAAAGGPPAGLTPAYVLTTAADGTPVLQYAQPESGNPAACPPGTGAGVFVPAKAQRAVVAVVGTAHVRGMAAAWHEACKMPDLQPFL